jgi:hypothetical protein
MECGCYDVAARSHGILEAVTAVARSLSQEKIGIALKDATSQKTSRVRASHFFRIIFDELPEL